MLLVRALAINLVSDVLAARIQHVASKKLGLSEGVDSLYRLLM